jgi:hypothetical protein
MQLPMAPQPALWNENPQREPVPITGDAERSLPAVSRRPKGNKNALKHGLYTADAIALRRLLASIRRD